MENIINYFTDTSLIYMDLGVIATILAGYFGIKYTSKSKNRTSIWYFEDSRITLFKSVVKELDELEIKYKNEPINENLIIYRGTFFNSGNTDIDKNVIHKPLKIILPPNYEWKKVKIINKSKDINIEFDNNSNSLHFSWDILRVDEYVTFDSVIEYKLTSDSSPSSESIANYLSNNISFEQRITNLEPIKTIDPSFSSLHGYKYTSLIFIAIIVFFSVLFGRSIVFPDYKNSYEVVVDSTSTFVTFKNKNANQIQFLNNSGKKLMLVDIKQINDNNMLTGKIKSEKDLKYLDIISGGLLILLVIILYIITRKSYKRIKNILIAKHWTTK